MFLKRSPGQAWRDHLALRVVSLVPREGARQTPSASTLRYPSLYLAQPYHRCKDSKRLTVRTWLHVLPCNTTYKPSNVLGQCHPSFPTAEATVRSTGNDFSKCDMMIDTRWGYKWENEVLFVNLTQTGSTQEEETLIEALPL